MKLLLVIFCLFTFIFSYEYDFFRTDLPLLTAARTGNLYLIKHLVEEKKVDPTEEHQIAFIVAIRYGFPEIVKYFLNNTKIDPMYSADGILPLSYATKYGHFSTFKALMYDPRVELDANDQQCLMLAIQNGQLRMTEYLFSALYYSVPEKLLYYAMTARDSRKEILTIVLNHQKLFTELLYAFQIPFYEVSAETLEVVLSHPRIKPEGADQALLFFNYFKVFADPQIPNVILRNERVFENLVGKDQWRLFRTWKILDRKSPNPKRKTFDQLQDEILLILAERKCKHEQVQLESQQCQQFISKVMGPEKKDFHKWIFYFKGEFNTNKLIDLGLESPYLNENWKNITQTFEGLKLLSLQA